MPVVICSACAARYEVPDDFNHPSFKCGQCGAVTQLGAMPQDTASQGAVPPANPFQSPNWQHSPMAMYGDQGRAPLVPTPLNVEQVLRTAYDRMSWPLIGLGLAAILLPGVINWGSGMVQDLGVSLVHHNTAAVIMVVALAQIVGGLVNMFFSLGQMRFFLRYARTGVLKFEDIFSGGPFLLRAIGINILLWLATVMGIGVLAGIPVGIVYFTAGPDVGLLFLLAIIPAVVIYIWAMLGVAMSLVVMVDHDLSVIESIQLSWAIMHGNRWQFILLGLVLIMINFAGLVMCCIGVLATMVVSLFIFYLAYLQMTGDPAFWGGPANSMEASAG